LNVVVADNGHGFDSVQPRQERNGLINMKLRLAEIGGVCHGGQPARRRLPDQFLRSVETAVAFQAVVSSAESRGGDGKVSAAAGGRGFARQTAEDPRVKAPEKSPVAEPQ